MAGPSSKYYGLFFKSAFAGEVDLEGGTVKLSLHTASYVPNQDTHQYYSSVTNEVTGTGYTAGGATVDNVAVSYNTSTNVLSFDADNVSWDNATLTGANQPQVAVLRLDTGTASTSPLIGFIDFGDDDDYAPSNGTLTVQWSANGIGSVTVA